MNPDAAQNGRDARRLRRRISTLAGELRIEHNTGGQLVESYADDAPWELMDFGKAHP